MKNSEIQLLRLILNLLFFLTVPFLYNEAIAGELQLSWTDNSNDEDGFKIERKIGTTGPFAQIASVGVNVATYTNTGLTDGTTYCYRIFAYNSAGNSNPTPEVCGAARASTQTFTLTVAKAGSGIGTVTSSPDGINCGSDCTQAYNSNTAVALTATPGSGSTFAGWSGTGCGSSVTMAANRNCTASFETQIAPPGGNPTPPPTTGSPTLLVKFGKSSALNSFGLSGWSSVIKDIYTDYQDLGPGGTTIVTSDNAEYNYQGVIGTARNFLSGEKISVTWYNNSPSTVTFTPKISFTDRDRPNSGGSTGTWYSMTSTTIPPHGIANSEYAFTSASAGSYSLVNVNVNYSNNRIIVADKIELLPAGSSSIQTLEISLSNQETRTVAAAQSATSNSQNDQVSRIGVFRLSTGEWFLDRDGDGMLNCAIDICVAGYGNGRMLPVVGDWYGTGRTSLGTFDPTNGSWHLDDGDGHWSACGTDICIDSFGESGDIPVVKRLSSSSELIIGVFASESGRWKFDTDGDGVSDNCGIDECIDFGTKDDIPITADWSGTGSQQLGIFRPQSGQWLIDLNGNSKWDGTTTDRSFPSFGRSGDRPVAGDWDGTGKTRIGIFRAGTGTWQLDVNGNGTFDGCEIDACINAYGQEGDLPVVGRW